MCLKEGVILVPIMKIVVKIVSEALPRFEALKPFHVDVKGLNLMKIMTRVSFPKRAMFPPPPPFPKEYAYVFVEKFT